LDFLRYGRRVQVQEMITKAVILARGLGTRMRAVDENSKLDSEQAKIAELGIKALIPIADKKTFLDFVLENLRSAGFTDICLIIGDEHEILKDFCRKNGLHFAIQEKPLGTANAVLSAEKFVNGELFLMVNADNLYQVKDLHLLQKLDSAGLIAFDKQSLILKSNITEEKINKFAVLSFDENNVLTKIIEKPDSTGKHALISMNAWIFSPKIFEACRNVKLSKRGEFELSDAVNFAIEKSGEKFSAIYSNKGVLDLSSRADIEKVIKKLNKNG
jgi:dTDP-glucose pyrophosphorylase